MTSNYSKELAILLILTCLIWHNQSALTPGLTPNFVNWLNAHNYGHYNFLRNDLAPQGASYGGKVTDSDSITKEPVIYIHGNSDKAIGFSGSQIGFTYSIEYFLSQGYTEAELYATTWGPADDFQASNQDHSKAYLTYLRAFVEAVLEYTGASKVDIIAHSMGVTLGRKVIQGGTGNDHGSYNLGSSLASKVDTFLGIAGANWGLTNCYTSSMYPTCASTNGLYPGYAIGPFGLSSYLSDINYNNIKEGTHVFSMYSLFDDLIGFGDIVWGQYTSKIPSQDGQMQFTDPIYTHMVMKDNTTAQQYNIVVNHVVGNYLINSNNDLHPIKGDEEAWTI